MDMKRYMSLPLLEVEKRELSEKIRSADALIREAFSISDRWYVSCSFGKDSVVVLHLVLKHKPDIPVVFINSGYCFPETYKVRDRIKHEWNINLIEIKQKVDYIELTREFGFSCDRTPTQQRKIVRKLKKTLMDGFALSGQYTGCFWGLRAEESKGRRELFRFRGSLFRDKHGLYRCSPIWDWKWEDVWRYIKLNKLPYSEIYLKDKIIDKKQIRNNSWLTMDGAPEGYVVWLKYYYPEIYNRLVREFGGKMGEYV